MKIPGVKDISEKTNVPPMFFALGLITVSVILVAFSLPMDFVIVQFISVAYPAFKSALALQTETMDDDKMWLTYWMVFGLFNMLDDTFGWFLSMIPFYYLIKLFVIIWLQNPVTQGALIVYRQAIAPFAKKYKSEIDTAQKEMEKALLAMGDFVSSAKKEVESSKDSKGIDNPEEKKSDEKESNPERMK